MKPRTIFLIPTLVVAALVTFGGTGFPQSELLTFDDLSGFQAPIPNGYGGLQWDQFNSYDTVYYSSFGVTNGLNNGVVSPNNLAFNQGGVPASISGGPFNLNSAYLVADWNDGLQLEVKGFVGATLTYDKTYTVGTQGPTLINFGLVGVDKVDFISSGGVPYGFPNGGGVQFGMDNLSISGSIPEPSTFALVGLGLAGVLVLHRRTYEKQIGLTIRRNEPGDDDSMPC